MNITYTEDSKTAYRNNHPGYLDVSGLTWYLFKSSQTANSIPSVRSIEKVDSKVFEYLNKNCVLLGDSKTLTKDDSKKSKSRFFNPYSYDENVEDVAVYIIEQKLDDINLTSPVIIKLTNDKGDIQFNASSFDNTGLENVIQKFYKDFAKKTDYDKDTFFGILINSGDGIEVKQIPIDDKFSKKLDIGINYGKEFETHHKIIVEKLKTNTNGLFIFHGAAGSGKTTYIKHLAKQFGGDRKFIFIPTTFIDTLTSPNIIPVLLENPNSVLVLEDAEKAVISREEGLGNESLVSSLLNIGDGILGSMLNLSIILTFNTARENVDKALLRKGRLHYEHEFNKLSIVDAQALINKLKKKFDVVEPMSLAEIYNIDDDNNHKEKEKPKFGFGV